MDWKYIKTQEGPRSFHMYQYIYSSLCNLPRNTNFSNSKKSAISCNQKLVKSFYFPLWTLKIAWQRPSQNDLPLVKFLKTLYIQKYGSVLSILYVWCFPFVLHTQNNHDTKVMKQTTCPPTFKKITVLLSWNSQDIKVRKQDYCTVWQDKTEDILI